MELTAILSLVSFAIAEGPEAFKLVTGIIADIKQKFNTPDERVAALNAVLSLMAPMTKE